MKIRLGGELFESSKSAFDRLRSPTEQVQPSSPFQANLLGAKEDSAKMAGTQAQSRSAQAQRFQPSQATLREAIRYGVTPESQNKSRFLDLTKAARVDEALAAAAASIVVPRQIAQSLTFSDEKIKASLTGEQATWAIANKEQLKDWVSGKMAAEDPAQASIFEEQVQTQLGANLTQDLVEQWMETPTERMASSLVETKPEQVTFSDLEEVLTDSSLDSFFKDKGLNLTSADMESMFGTNWKTMTYKGFQEALREKQSQFSDVGRLRLLYQDSSVPAYVRKQAADQLRALGYTGATASFDQLLTVQEQIMDGYTIEINGAPVPVDEVLTNESLSSIIETAVGAGLGSPEMDSLKESMPDLGRWVESNVGFLQEQYLAVTGEQAVDVATALSGAQQRIERKQEVANRKDRLTVLGMPENMATAISDNIEAYNSEFINFLAAAPGFEWNSVNRNSAIWTMFQSGADPKFVQGIQELALELKDMPGIDVMDNLLNTDLYERVPVMGTRNVFNPKTRKWESKQVQVSWKRGEKTAAGEVITNLLSLSGKARQNKINEIIGNTTKYQEEVLQMPVDDFIKELAGDSYSPDFVNELNSTLQTIKETPELQKYADKYSQLDVNKDGNISREDFDRMRQGMVDNLTKSPDLDALLRGDTPDALESLIDQFTSQLEVLSNYETQAKDIKDKAAAEETFKKEYESAIATGGVGKAIDKAKMYGFSVPQTDAARWNAMSPDQKSDYLADIERQANQFFNQEVNKATAPLQKSSSELKTTIDLEKSRENILTPSLKASMSGSLLKDAQNAVARYSTWSGKGSGHRRVPKKGQEAEFKAAQDRYNAILLDSSRLSPEQFIRKYGNPSSPPQGVSASAWSYYMQNPPMEAGALKGLEAQYDQLTESIRRAKTGSVKLNEQEAKAPPERLLSSGGPSIPSESNFMRRGR